MKRTTRCLRSTLVLVAAACSTLFASAQTPLNLFNGGSLLGWNAHGPWAGSAGVLFSNGSGNRTILTAVPFADFSMQFEYNETTPIGAKLRLWTNHEAGGGVSVDLDISGTGTGVAGIEGSVRGAIASVSPGWHRVDIEAVNGQLTTKVDGQFAASNGGHNGRAGYIGFEAGGSGQVQFRNIVLTPRNLAQTFNGTDLGGWKSIARAPESKGGVGHDVEKTLTFGIGGGSTKPHSAKWTVQSSALHGEDGPGGLENGTPATDAIIQIMASERGNSKPENFTGLSLRTTAGKLTDGYVVGVGRWAGSIDRLAKKNLANENGPVDETIVLAGRTFAIWIGSNLATVYTDPRPEGANSAQGARTAAGAMTFVLPGNGVQLDVQKMSVQILGRNYGTGAPQKEVVAAPPQPAPEAPSAAQQGGSANAAQSPAVTALLEQQKAAAQQSADDKQNKQRSAALMSQALATADPQQQMNLYSQVVQMDPTNAPAVQGYKDAQAKVQATQAAQQQQISTEVYQQHDQLTKEQQTNASLAKAQGAFLAGHLGEASQALNVAERLAPDNPLVRDLRMRIGASNAFRSRLLMLGSGAGILALITMILLWRRRGKQQRYPILEVVRGLDEGRRYPLDKDTVRIGAVAQDGGQKNDIVIRDVEHMISRFHCEVTKKNGELYLVDLKSSNGTKLDGERLDPGRPMPLRKGAKVLLADSVELRLGYDSKPAATSTKA